MRTLNPLGGLQRTARIVLLFSKYSVYRLSGVEQSPYSAEKGKVVELAEVLMLCDGAKVTAGTPLIAGAKVAAEVVAQERSGKLIVFKKKRRQNYRRKKHHRQEYTVLKITGIKRA